MKSIYVAASSQHVGKTTCTLGLTASLKRLGMQVGYCKPVGQQFVELGELLVDKDAVLFSKEMGFDLVDYLHSPVILGPGATTAYIKAPHEFAYRKRIEEAIQQLQDRHEVIVYEGTGHPGVGSVVGLSNAEVARMTGAGVIMIVEGGIGSTIDELNRSLALFREHDIPILGVILNKVLVDKMDKVRQYVGKYLIDHLMPPLLGILPYDKSLSNPIMETINLAVRGRIVANANKMDNRVEDIVPGSLVGDQQEVSNAKNILLVVSSKRFSSALNRIRVHAAKMALESTPLSGIIVTGDGRHERNFDITEENSAYVNEHQIPIVTTPLDTLGSMIKINRIEVKINTRTPWKARRAIELIEEHIDFDTLQLQLQRLE